MLMLRLSLTGALVAIGVYAWNAAGLGDTSEREPKSLDWHLEVQPRDVEAFAFALCASGCDVGAVLLNAHR